MRTYPHVLAAFYGTAWAILPEKLREIEAVLLRRIGRDSKVEPVVFDDGEVPPARGESKPYTMHGAAAVIPIHGTITPRPSVFANYSGGTSAEAIGRAVDHAANDPQAEAIVLDIDSPGGSVFGLPEAAAKIFAARKAKPVHAVANHVAASAAYWLATQADTVSVTPAGQVGSVGVIWAHTDQSKLNENMGLKTTYVTAGKYKAEANSDQPLDAEAAAEMQRVVDEYYAMFVTAVTKGRGVKVERVERDFGQGRMSLAQQAIDARMADRIATLDTVIAEVNKVRASRTRARVKATLASAGLPTA